MTDKPNPLMIERVENGWVVQEHTDISGDRMREWVFEDMLRLQEFIDSYFEPDKVFAEVPLSPAMQALADVTRRAATPSVARAALSENALFKHLTAKQGEQADVEKFGLPAPRPSEEIPGLWNHMDLLRMELTKATVNGEVVYDKAVSDARLHRVPDIGTITAAVIKKQGL